MHDSLDHLGKRIRRIYGLAKARTLGFNPYGVDDSYRVVLPISKETAERVLAIGDDALRDCALDALHIFKRSVDEAYSVHVNTLGKVRPLRTRD